MLAGAEGGGEGGARLVGFRMPGLQQETPICQYVCSDACMYAPQFANDVLYDKSCPLCSSILNVFTLFAVLDWPH